LTVDEILVPRKELDSQHRIVELRDSRGLSVEETALFGSSNKNDTWGSPTARKNAEAMASSACRVKRDWAMATGWLNGPLGVHAKAIWP